MHVLHHARPKIGHLRPALSQRAIVTAIDLRDAQRGIAPQRADLRLPLGERGLPLAAGHVD